MCGATIACRIGTTAMAIPTYSGNGLLLVAGASACVIAFRYAFSRIARALWAGGVPSISYPGDS